VKVDRNRGFQEEKRGSRERKEGKKTRRLAREGAFSRREKKGSSALVCLR
jgi:hypothetical protein